VPKPKLKEITIRLRRPLVSCIVHDDFANIVNVGTSLFESRTNVLLDLLISFDIDPQQADALARSSMEFHEST